MNNKKRIFISIPFKGRTNEDIRRTLDKITKVLEVMFDGEEIELIDNFLPVKAPPIGVNDSIWYKGLAIKKLAECTHICHVRREEFYEGNPDFYRGCYIEQKVAELYNLERINLGNFGLYCPDLAR